MASDPVKASHPFSRRLLNIVTIIDRFHVEAERKGDTAFAEALKACALMISGGNLTCPLGNLVVEETLRTGQFPLSALTPKAPETLVPPPPGGPQTLSSAIVNPALKAIEWRNTFTKLWALLQEEAKRTGDKACLSALQECEEPSETHRCPVRELIAQHLKQGR
jgi:hypothetical protein